jgi:UDP-N-acetyl-D-galactosamine dehydrogenase
MKKIAIIGLGYVGLPLAVEFAKKRPVVGFDISEKRIKELNEGHDPTLEVSDEDLNSVLVNYHPPVTSTPLSDREKTPPSEVTQMPDAERSRSTGLHITNSLIHIQDCQIYIIAVPTPTDKNNRPDLTPLIKASETVGKVLKDGDIVIYESTVYPGATEEDCVPVLERVSGKKMNQHFFVGYSPERINPGDKVHTLTTIKKVTSGSTPAIGQEVDALYREIITAGTHLAPSIKVAEAAKVIENSQRDINIAFVNELSKIFHRMGIDTLEVLEAAGTKWNFLPFRPGLVGGHCIGVDPYYLAQKAQEVGYHPEIILAGRRLNDGMGAYVAGEVVKLMLKAGKPVMGAKALMLGITFKENCPDIRNTRAIDIYRELQTYGMEVDIYDTWASAAEVTHEYGIEVLAKYPDGNGYGAIILAVAHNEFKNIDMVTHKAGGTIIYDVKGILPKEIVDARL